VNYKIIATAFAALWLITGCGQTEKKSEMVAETPEPMATASVEVTTATESFAPPATAPAALESTAPMATPGAVNMMAPSTAETTNPMARLEAPYEANRSVYTQIKVEVIPDKKGPAQKTTATSAKEPLIKVDSHPMGDGPVLTGLDVMKREQFSSLKGKTVALLTNHSAIDRDGNHVLDLMMNQPNVNIVKLFSPEHGLYGNVDTKTPDVKDPATGLMVHSLYSTKPDNPKKPHHPRAATLEGVDAVIVDLQDIGARYYTYCSYMGYMMEVCAKLGIEVIVLDRPNPVGGVYVDGPIMDEDLEGMVTGYFRMPIAHGMTMGELARMFNTEKKIDCKLTVVPCEGWKRDMFFDETGLRWVNPSPNIQDLDAALVYTGIAIPESIVSMGRGTDEPFHIFGAPYFEDSQKLVDELTTGGLPGIRLEAADFTPTGTLSRDHVGEGRVCHGARMHITDRKTMRPVLLGVRLMDYLQRHHGTEMIDEMKWNAAAKKSLPTGKKVPRIDLMKLRGASSAILCARIREGKSLDDTMKFIDEQVAGFMPMRAKYLLYPSEK
jgi:uncharacterized protein YbbC (DUF1343 family)